MKAYTDIEQSKKLAASFFGLNNYIAVLKLGVPKVEEHIIM